MDVAFSRAHSSLTACPWERETRAHLCINEITQTLSIGPETFRVIGRHEKIKKRSEGQQEVGSRTSEGVFTG